VSDSVQVLVVAGPAASGKSEFAKKLSAHLNYPWLDFDDFANELINENKLLIDSIGMESFLAQVREKRYRDLIDRAVVAVKQGKSIVVSAPFTAEVQNQDLWDARIGPLTSLGISSKLYWIETKPEVRHERMVARSSERDVEKKEEFAKYIFQTIAPVVERVTINGEADFAEVVPTLASDLNK
jgi:dephospho-CoA kinase